MTLQFSLVIRFGKQRFYAFNKAAKGICEAFNKPCLTREKIDALKKHGFNIRIIGFRDGLSDVTDEKVLKTIREEINSLPEEK